VNRSDAQEVYSQISAFIHVGREAGNNRPQAAPSTTTQRLEPHYYYYYSFYSNNCNIIYIYVKLQLVFSQVAVVQQYNRQVTYYTQTQYKHTTILYYIMFI
jgi:hypothetical protein